MLLLILFTMMHDVTTSNAPKLSTSLYVLHQYHPHKAGSCGTLSGINYLSLSGNFHHLILQFHNVTKQLAPCL